MLNTYEIHGDVVVIHLRRRKKPDIETIIDLADFEIADAFPGRFYAMWSEDSQTYYCIGHGKGAKSVLLHRLIKGAKLEEEVDHCKHDGLDNRRDSLAIVSHSANAFNRRGARKGSRSGVRGVYWHAKSSGWRIQVRDTAGNRFEVGGTFPTVEGAATARAEWIEENQKGKAAA